jgi:Glycosyl hydrolases family 16
MNQASDDWNIAMLSGGGLVRTQDGLRFTNPQLDGTVYCNAQLDDYQGLARSEFCNCPPLRLRLRARFSHRLQEIGGTAGFGFWNDPFMMTGWRMPTLPRALWFFLAAPPSDMRLAVETPGVGWKAAALDALQPRGVLSLPLAGLAAPFMRSRRLYRRLWPWFERGFGIAERRLDGMTAGPITEWHTYGIDWGPRQATFYVDGGVVLRAPSPQGPLGFVAWLDNQSLIVHPSGRLRHGLVAKSTQQWMEIDDLHLERLTP